MLNGTILNKEYKFFDKNSREKSTSLEELEEKSKQLLKKAKLLKDNPESREYQTTKKQLLETYNQIDSINRPWITD